MTHHQRKCGSTHTCADNYIFPFSSVFGRLTTGAAAGGGTTIAAAAATLVVAAAAILLALVPLMMMLAADGVQGQQNPLLALPLSTPGLSRITPLPKGKCVGLAPNEVWTECPPQRCDRRCPGHPQGPAAADCVYTRAAPGTNCASAPRCVCNPTGATPLRSFDGRCVRRKIQFFVVEFIVF